MWWEGCTCGVHYNAMYFVDCEYTYSECVDLRVWKSYGFIEFKDRAGKNFHWCVAHFIFARQPVQWAAQPGSAQAAQAENHQLKICDVIGRDRGAPSAGEHTDRGVSPLWLYSNCYLWTSGEPHHRAQFIGSQDHLALVTIWNNGGV